MRAFARFNLNKIGVLLLSLDPNQSRNLLTG